MSWLKGERIAWVIGTPNNGAEPLVIHPKCSVCGKDAPGASPHIRKGKACFYCDEHMPDISGAVKI